MHAIEGTLTRLQHTCLATAGRATVWLQYEHDWMRIIIKSSTMKTYQAGIITARNLNGLPLEQLARGHLNHCESAWLTTHQMKRGSSIRLLE